MSRFRRLERDERRAQILAAARRLFSERGYSSVSMGDVADAAGVARGLVNHYFGAKRDLYVEVVREVVALPPLPLPPAADQPRADLVAQSVDAWLRMIERDRRTWLAALGAEALRDPEIEAILEDAAEATVERVLLVLGIADATASERAAIRAYGAMAQQATREWLGRGRLSRSEVHALLTGTLIALLEQIMPRLAGPRS